MTRKLNDSTPPEPAIKAGLIPVIVGILLTMLTVLLWWTLKGQEHSKRHKLIKDKSDKLITYLEADMRSRIPALERMVIRWEIRGGTPEKEFINDAYAYIEDFPGFQALEWVDKKYIVRRVIPLAGNEKALDLDMAFEEKRRLTLEKAKNRRNPTMTPPIDLVQGGKGFLVYLPIYVNGEFDGFILAVFRIEAWLDYVFGIKESLEDLSNFRVLVSIEDIPVYAQSGFETIKDYDLDEFSEARLLGHRVMIQCRPTEAFIERSSTMFPEFIALIGLVLTIMVSFIVHLFQKASTEAWRTHAAKNALEIEIEKHKKTEETLNQISSSLTLATKAAKTGVWVWNVESGSLTWSDLMYTLYDIPPDVTPTYETWRNALHPDDMESAESLLNKAIEGKAVFETEFRIMLPGGVIRHIQAAANVERDSRGKAVSMTGVNWDITKRKKAAEQLATERRRLADILEGTNVGTWEWNVQTGETVFNERWANIIGCTLKELAPVTIDTWTGKAHPDDLKVSGELLEKHFKGELDYYDCEIRMLHKNGSWVWVHDRGKVATWTAEGKPLLMSGTHQDITERKKAEDQIRHLATHDALTDLPGLRLAEDRVKMVITMAHRNKIKAAVLFIDLDGFKSVNDTHGHDAGDALLKETACRLLSCIRETDTIARIGGDEFLAVLSEVKSADNAAEVAKKIIGKVSQSFTFNGNMTAVGASIGIALYPENGQNSEELIKQADDAMYKSKKSGKNKYTFSTSF